MVRWTGFLLVQAAAGIVQHPEPPAIPAHKAKKKGAHSGSFVQREHGHGSSGTDTTTREPDGDSEPESGSKAAARKLRMEGKPSLMEMDSAGEVMHAALHQRVLTPNATNDTNGTSDTDTTTAATEEKADNTMMIVGGIVALALILGGVGFAVMSQSAKNAEAEAAEEGGEEAEEEAAEE